MKILHSEASCGWGGQEIRILEEARGLIERGHEVSLVCPPEARILTESSRFGVPAVALPIGRKNFAGLFALRRHLRVLRPEVVNTHSSTDSWLAALACASLTDAPPIVRTRHISAPVHPGWTTRWLYRNASSRIVTTGERLREELIHDLDLAPERIVSVPTGVDLARYAPADRQTARHQLGLPETACIVGIVATLRSWKGHRYLLDAFSRLTLPDLHLVVVGDGPGRDNIRQQALDLGIHERMTQPGNQRDVAPWLAALDIFALPSYANEGVPQAIMQAMSTGLPVVSTPVGSIAEIVADGVTGLIVPPRDTDALTEALERLCRSSELRTKLGQAALAQAQVRFSRDLMLDRMEAVFIQAVSVA